MMSQTSAKELEDKMRQAEKEAKELEMKKKLAEEEREKTRKENLSQKQKTEAMVMNLWLMPFLYSILWQHAIHHLCLCWPVVHVTYIRIAQGRPCSQILSDTYVFAPNV